MDEPCTSRKLFMAAPMAIVVVYRHASLDILSPQVKSAPPQGSCLWLRPQAALWKMDGFRIGAKKTPRRVMVNEFETIPALKCLQRNWLRFLPKDFQPRAIFAAGLFFMRVDRGCGLERGLGVGY